MARYIDADALRNMLQSLSYDDWNQGVSTTWANAFAEVEDMVWDFPTADVQEVRHGSWLIERGACEPDYMECSACGWITEYYGGLEEEWNYCPGCGALMGADDGEIH